MILTGLLGGSFNPAHGGHRRISLFAHDGLGLDEVWWLVSPGNVLKPKAGMASLSARYASASDQSRGAPIRPSALERELGTRFTVDSLRKIKVRWPKRRFVWLMGSDNLAQFHRWRDWRGIARLMPIAVVARPGYDASAMASPAMAWLRQFRISPARLRTMGRSAPALILLRFDPDKRSATQLRRTNPGWAQGLGKSRQRDAVTHRLIPSNL